MDQTNKISMFFGNRILKDINKTSSEMIRCESINTGKNQSRGLIKRIPIKTLLNAVEEIESSLSISEESTSTLRNSVDTDFLSIMGNIKENLNYYTNILKENNGNKDIECLRQINSLGKQLVSLCQNVQSSITHSIPMSSNPSSLSSSQLKTGLKEITQLPLPYTLSGNTIINDKFDGGSRYIHSIRLVSGTIPSLKKVEFDSSITPNTIERLEEVKKSKSNKICKKKTNKPTQLRKPHDMDGKPCTHCLSINKTPEWRSGPYGPNKICNACGLFYRKLKDKFGLSQADIIMKYRRINCASNRRVPPTFDIPKQFLETVQNDTTSTPLTPVTPITMTATHINDKGLSHQVENVRI